MHETREHATEVRRGDFRGVERTGEGRAADAHAFDHSANENENHDAFGAAGRENHHRRADEEKDRSDEKNRPTTVTFGDERRNKNGAEKTTDVVQKSEEKEKRSVAGRQHGDGQVALEFGTVNADAEVVLERRHDDDAARHALIVAEEPAAERGERSENHREVRFAFLNSFHRGRLLLLFRCHHQRIVQTARLCVERFISFGLIFIESSIGSD